MPQRAPTYYHWSMDKPCTTNSTYGFYIKDDITTSVKGKKEFNGPFDYTRPFSNSGFFPQISYKNYLTAKKTTPAPSVNKFDINKGYVMGHVPVTEKLHHRSVPSGFKLSRSLTAPPAHEYTQSKAKDIFLWHTLSGCLVNAKNYPPRVEVSQ